MALTEKTTRLLDEKDEVVREHFVKSLLSLLTGRKYDPTVEQSKLLRTLEKVGKSDGYAELEAMANLITLLTTKTPDTRNYRAEARELIRSMFPIGEVDGQQDPGPVGSDDHIDGEPGNDKLDRVERILGKVAPLEMPYGRQLEELNELIASIEKTEGRSLTAVETRDVNRLFNTAIETGQPQTLKLDPSKAGGYLIMAAKPEDVGGDLLGLILGLGLGARR